MAFDGFITGAVAISLDKTLSGGKIDRLFQPDKNDLILHIYKDKVNYKLLISANSSHPRLVLLPADHVDENPKNPPAFTMLMRKHFRGGRIEKIEQYQSERIIEFSVVQRDELGFPVNKKLIVEIMGKHSNIVALDSDTGKILDSIKRIPSHINRYRSILPGLEYVYPPDRDKIPFYDLKEGDLEEAGFKESVFEKIQGISPSMASEISATAEGEGISILEVLQGYERRILSGDYRGIVYQDDTGFPVDFHIFQLPQKESLYNKKEFPDLNSCLLYYYSNKDLGNRINQKSGDLIRHIGSALDKLYLKKERLEADLVKAENAEIYRVYGELLTASLHSIERGGKSANVLNYYDNTEIEIPLDPKYTPVVNAKNYFKKFNKSKTAQKEKQIQIKETQEAIVYLESALVFAENARLIWDLDLIREELIEEGFLNRRQKKQALVQKAAALSFSPQPNITIRVGRNNKENDQLTFKQAGKKDLWFHAKDVPGSHVILSFDSSGAQSGAGVKAGTGVKAGADDKGQAGRKAGTGSGGKGRDPAAINPELLEKAAGLAAYYSKARDSSNVAVDYTFVSNVKKIPGARPGMVTYKNHKTIFVDPKETV